jgi:hypothetical protein
VNLSAASADLMHSSLRIANSGRISWLLKIC